MIDVLRVIFWSSFYDAHAVIIIKIINFRQCINFCNFCQKKHTTYTHTHISRFQNRCYCIKKIFLKFKMTNKNKQIELCLCHLLIASSLIPNHYKWVDKMWHVCLIKNKNCILVPEITNLKLRKKHHANRVAFKISDSFYRKQSRE